MVYNLGVNMNCENQMPSWARVQYEKKQLNKVLVRCKNSVHKSKKTKTLRKDEKRLSRESFAWS